MKGEPMLKIKISKKELKNLYLDRSAGEARETTIYQGEDNVPDGNLVLLRAMLEIFKDKSGSMVVPEFCYTIRNQFKYNWEAA